MKIRTVPVILTFIIYLLSFKIWAQEKEISLKSALDDLEVRYDVHFTYLDENVEEVFISPISAESDLDKILAFISEQTGLNFERLEGGFISISKPVGAYTDVCGHLIDIESGDPLFGATIENDNGYAIADQNGYFNLEQIEVTSTILIRSVGYESQQVIISSGLDECLTIEMVVATSMLKGIVIPNYLTKGINKKVDGSFSINTQTLGILPGLIEPDLIHSLQNLPGIQSINETVSDINVRGGTNDQNLILWDGIRMYQSGHFFGLISVFNPYITEKMNLIKNGTSASHGDGVSSTISIQTEDDIPDRITGGGGINMLYADAFLQIPVSGNASLNISGRTSIGNLIETPTYTQYFSRAFRDTDVFNSSAGADSLANSDESFHFYDYNLNFIWKISNKDKIKINFLHVLDELKFTENAIINNLTESKTSTLDQKSTAGNLFWNRLWSNRLTTSLILNYSRYNLDALNVNLFEDQTLIQENEVLDYGLKLDSRYSVSNKFDFLLGYQFSEIGITNLEDINNPDFRRLEKKVIDTHSGYAELYYNYHNTTNLSAGIRVNYFDQLDQFTIEPRLSFNQTFLEYFSIEILAEMKSQSTSQIIDFQTDFLGVEKRRWILSDGQNVPIMRSRQASLGFTFNKENVLLSLEGYIKKVKDINSLSQGFQNQFQFEKTIGDYEASGLDFLLSRKLGNFDTWTGYSYAVNNYEFPDFEPAAFPNNLDITHTVSSGVNYNSSSWELSTGFNWRTGKPYTKPVESQPVLEGEINYQSPNSTRIEDYLRFDFSGVYNFPIGSRVKGQVGLSIWNLLNRDNVINVYYVLDNNNEVRQIQQSALEITPNLMTRFTF